HQRARRHRARRPPSPGRLRGTTYRPHRSAHRPTRVELQGPASDEPVGSGPPSGPDRRLRSALRPSADGPDRHPGDARRRQPRRGARIAWRGTHRMSAPDASHTADGHASGEALSHRQILIIFSGLMLALLLAALDQTIVGTALPTIVGELHGLNHLSWVVTAYLLTSTTVALLYGKISDLYVRKPVYQVAIVLLLMGSALPGLRQHMPQSIIFHAVPGLTAGCLP